MRIVVEHDPEGRWWWTAFGNDGALLAISAQHASRSDCVRSIAELKVEGPVAPVNYGELDRPASSSPRP